MASTTLTNRSDKFVLVRTWVARVLVDAEPGTWADGPFSRENVDRNFNLAVASGLYGPHTGNRIRVMTWQEWERVSS